MLSPLRVNILLVFLISVVRALFRSFIVSSDFSFRWIYAVRQSTVPFELCAVFEGILMAVSPCTHSFSLGWIFICVERKIVYWLEKLGQLLVDASMTRAVHPNGMGRHKQCSNARSIKSYCRCDSGAQREWDLIMLPILKRSAITVRL